VTALAGVSLSVDSGEYFCLLGPSGCGKTTLLRLIAGLDQADAGVLRLDGADTTAVPAHRRPVNTVFQSYALFPHLSVRENVAFGLRMKKVPAAELGRRVDAVMDLAQIRALADRSPGQLSGGQKQRVALARALVNEPRVLLLDEPLGALDLALRRELQRELRALQQRLGVTFVHVTHDQEEALALADRMAVLQSGRVAQVGTPAEVYERPRTRFVAAFLGACNLIPGTVRESAGATVVVETALGPLSVRAPAPGALRTGTACTLAVRPERLATAASGPWSGAVREVVYRGADVQLTLEVRGVPLRVHEAAAGDRPRVGDTRHLAPVPGEALVLLED
jgi:spermidine/putrescine transport system ATP-binding protein